MDAAAIRPPLWADLKPSQLFEKLADPPSRYRPVPWLAWTGDLDWPVLEGQLADMLAKGVTEFFLFPIYGMELPYMSAVYWERVNQTLAFCSANGMKCWIYDEYNWPSGVCAGQVLRDHPEYNEKRIWLRPVDQRDDAPAPPGAGELQRSGRVEWAIVENQSLHINVRGCDWLAAVPGYLDVLSPEANRCFIEYTHDRYHKHCASAFPETIPGFFTDEPGMHAAVLGEAASAVPYTDDLFEAFEARYGYDLREHLEDLAIDTPFSRRTRCHYWRWVAERFGEAYGGQQRAWCDEHGVALTGHCLGEECLHYHAGWSGDLWEILRRFTIPGIDMLANADGFNFPYRVGFYSVKQRRAFHMTCKLVHSIVRHTGGREMMSEAYGVCDWGMNLLRQKCGFNYQVALGVTLFNDNSLITSIADFRKWAIAGKHFTQPWWAQYKQYADYNARLAALHAEGEPVARVAVLYPRSTVWTHCNAQAITNLQPLESQLLDLLDELVREQWHFDFMFEPVLAEATVEDGELVTPHARYRVLIAPSATDLPADCVDVLTQFAAGGGVLLLAGDAPEREVDSQADLADAVAGMLAGANAAQLDATATAALDALGAHLKRPIVLSGEGSREFITSWRRLAGGDVLFVANMAEAPAEIRIDVQLDGRMVVCDPDTLERFQPELDADGRFDWRFEPWQAFLVIVGDAAESNGDLPGAPAWWSPAAEQTLDGDWRFAIEPGAMLRLTTDVRPDPDNRGAAEGWRRDTGPDGWVTTEDGRQLAEPLTPADARWYWMRSSVECEAPDAPRFVVCDNPDFLEVYVNGKAAEPVEHEPLWTEENVWFDVSGLFVEGANTIHVRARTSKYSDPRVGAFPVSAKLLQPVVLVGDFRVVDDNRLVASPGTLDASRPWEQQGLPHAAGVGVYEREIDWDGHGRLVLHLPKCHDAVEVRVNGAHAGATLWPPYVFDLTDHLRTGANALEIRVRNTLGNIITETYAGARPDQPPTSGLEAPPRLLRV